MSIRRNVLPLLALLVLPALSLGQSVKLPPETTGVKNEWVMIVPESFDGGEPKYFLGEGLERVPIEKMFPTLKPVGVVVKAKKDGVYYVYGYNAKGDVASDPAKCKVIIGTPPDPVDPVDPPKPPGPDPPKPPPGPTPTPAPIPLPGLRVLVIIERSDMGKLTADQEELLYATKAGSVQDFCQKHCVGKSIKIWDKDVKLADIPAEYRDVWQKPRQLDWRYLKDGRAEVFNPRTNFTYKTYDRATDAQKAAAQTIPWLVISNGETGYEGPLPANAASMLGLLNLYVK